MTRVINSDRVTNLVRCLRHKDFLLAFVDYFCNFLLPPRSCESCVDFCLFPLRNHFIQMSNNGPQSQTQEGSFVNEDFYEQEPGEINKNAGRTTFTTRPNQRPRTQFTFSDAAPSNFIEHTARRLKLESLVDDYRDGRKTKAVTLEAIERELEGDPQLTDEEKESVLRLYHEEIDSAESRIEHGYPSSERVSSRRRKASEKRDSSGGASSTKTSSHLRQSDSESNSEGDDDEPKKRLRLEEADMPWFKRRGTYQPSSNPSCIKTVKSLRLFNRDIKGCKFLVSVATGSPDNIPPSQWERIFKGESIDLDQILSSLHRVTVTEERKTRIGEADIVLGPIEATRKITTSSDWSTAWRRASRAISFVFPHRTRELDDYAEYIESEFAAKLASGHQRIILFDIAVRNLVRGGQQIVLTDTQKFGSLYSAIVLPDGVQYANSGRKAIQSRGRTEICNRFNAKGCTSTSCRYRHVCKKCGSTDHGQTACGAAAKN